MAADVAVAAGAVGFVTVAGAVGNYNILNKLAARDLISSGQVVVICPK